MSPILKRLYKGRHAPALSKLRLLPLAHPLPPTYFTLSIELTRAHLRSALIAQHLRDICVDVIMVDDGSTDASLPLLYSIAANPLYPNYSVLPLSPNGGAAAARNAGVSTATGKVIAFAESDDWYLAHHLWSCLSSFIKEPNIAFTKTKIDMGSDIHPHWQTGVEDVSPLNTCVRRESFLFAGGFPTTDLFRDDMEDGHMAIILHSLYRGAKLYTHTSRYRIRHGNQLHQRMPQFTSPPGHAPLIQSDVENTEKRMAAIQEATVIAKDRLSEYQDLDLLSSIDPLSPIGRATHAQRRRRFFAPSFPVLQVDGTNALRGVKFCCSSQAQLTRLLQSRYALQQHGLVLWLGLDATGLAEALAHLLYTDKRNPLTIWVPMREIQSLKQEQEQLLLDVSCSFMSISNSKWAHQDGVVHPCLAPPTPAPQSPLPSISEVQPPTQMFS